MKNVLKLVLGELNRFVKYGILPISLVTAVMWVLLFFAVSAQEARTLAPLFIFTDVAVMSVVLIGASYHLEKQEGTIKSMMIMPVSLCEILTAKVISSMVLAVESTIVTAAALYFIHGITLDYGPLVLFVVAASCAHAAIGFLLSLLSRDFSSALGFLMTYMFIFTIPSMLFSFGIIQQKYEWLLMLSPSHAASNLVTSAVSGSYDKAKVIAALIYLPVLSAALFKFAVYPGFKSNAVRG